MTDKLTDRDEKRFAELREKLDGVDRAVKTKQARPSPGPIDPMLAQTFVGQLSDLEESTWIAEQKYNGTRIVLQKFNGDVRCFTRRHVERDVTPVTP